MLEIGWWYCWYVLLQQGVVDIVQVFGWYIVWCVLECVEVGCYFVYFGVGDYYVVIVEVVFGVLVVIVVLVVVFVDYVECVVDYQQFVVYVLVEVLEVVQYVVGVVEVVQLCFVEGWVVDVQFEILMVVGKCVEDFQVGDC